MNQHKVILTGGDHYNGLSLVRMFGSRGYKPYGIIIGEKAENGFLKASRYWEKIWTVDSEDQMRSILETYFSEEDNKPVIIPWSDGAASYLDRNLESLKERFLLPGIAGRQGAVYELMDKGMQIGFAKECGFKMADSFEVDLFNNRDFPVLKFPCIGKPIVSSEGEKKDIRKINNISELQEYLDYLKNKGYRRILIQEYIQIDTEYDVEGFVNDQDYSFFVSQKIRTWPNIGGPTAYSVSVDNEILNNEIMKIITKLKEMNYSGLFDIEIFKEGNRFLFNEINWRNSAVCFAASSAGVQYPLYWFQSITGETPRIHVPDHYGDTAMVELLDINHIVSGDVGPLRWLVQLFQCKAYAYFNIKDLRPLFKRLRLYISRKVR